MRARLIIALLGVAVIAPISMAQMRSFPVALGHTISFNQPLHPRSPGAILLGSPALYADYPAEPLAVQTAPPQVVIVQPAATPDVSETKAEPLMIELQGNHYVRFGGLPQSADRGVDLPSDYSEAAKSSKPAPQLPPAILIFRDGHREQVREYVIVAGVLYADQNYWQDGHWTKNIQLSALNLPATAKANLDSGVTFRLPSAPNEVVVGP